MHWESGGRVIDEEHNHDSPSLKPELRKYCVTRKSGVLRNNHVWCGCADECSRSVREKDSVVEYYAWNFGRTVQDREEYGMHFSFSCKFQRSCSSMCALRACASVLG